MTEELSADPPSADQFEKVCHDLKQNIATGLLLCDPQLADRVDAQVRQRLEMLHQQWEEAAALVAILGEGPRVSARHADLAELARVCVEAARATHRVDLEISGADHVVPADGVLLRRAVRNLLDNACRATRETGRVLVQVASGDAAVWVVVSDEGPGFGGIGAGSGLGLEIVRSAVWDGGGRLVVESGPRGGTSVRMTFPAALRVVS